MTRRFCVNALKYLLAIGLLTYVVWSNWGSPDDGKSLSYLWHKHVVLGQPVHFHFLALAAVCCSGAVLITFLRWYMLVRAVGLPFRVPDALRLGLVGFFFNIFMPGGVGGDIIKAAFLAREQKRRTVAVATVIMDRAIALWSLIWFVAVLGVVFWAGGLLHGAAERESKLIVKMAGAVVGLTLTGWLLLGLLPEHRAERFAGRLSRLPKFGGNAAEFWRAVWIYRCRQRSVLAAMLISWVGFVGFVLTFYFSVLTVYDPGDALKIPTLSEHFLITPIGMVANALPAFPGGLGVGELAFGALYEWFGCSEDLGVVGSFVQRVLQWVLGLAGYLVYMRMRATLPTEPAPSPELAAVEA